MKISQQGAAFLDPVAGPTNLTEIGGGWYSVTLANADTNFSGTLAYQLQAPADPVGVDLVDLVLPIINGYLAVAVDQMKNNSITADAVQNAALTQPKFGDQFIRPESFTNAALEALFSGTAMAPSYAANGAAPTPAQALMMILQLLSNRGIAGTTLTIRGLDGTTPVMTFALNSATAPTLQTRAT